MEKKQYKLILSKDQEEKLADWTYMIKNDIVVYIPIKWKKSAAVLFEAEGRETS